MAIDSVAVDDPILASRENQLISHVNGTPGRAIFTSNGVWSVPAGVYQFKVYVAGGGGKGGPAVVGSGESFGFISDGKRGGDAPLCSKIITGQDIGTSFAITIGAGATGSGAGGTTTFGALLQSTGGSVGSEYAQGTSGTHTGTIRHGNAMFQASQDNGYGQGGRGGVFDDNAGANGNNGICVIEW